VDQSDEPGRSGDQVGPRRIARRHDSSARSAPGPRRSGDRIERIFAEQPVSPQGPWRLDLHDIVVIGGSAGALERRPLILRRILIERHH